MKTLYLHIGAPKTGSTAIQRVATESRERLASCGLLYPEAALRGFGHHDIAFLLNDGYPDWATPQDVPLETLSQAMADECAGFDGDVLLSSENFYLFPQPQRLHTLLQDTGLLPGRHVQVIVYLRRQDDLLVSWHNQMIKAQGYAGGLEEAWADTTALWNYERQLALWAGTFGDAALNVRRYDEKDLQHDFWRTVCPGFLADDGELGQERINISLSRDLLEFQKIVNRLPLSIVEKRKFHHELMLLTQAGTTLFEDAPVMTPELRRRVQDFYAASNAAVAARWFGGAVLFDDGAASAAALNNESDRVRAVPTASGPAAYRGIDLEKVIAVFAWLMMRQR